MSQSIKQNLVYAYKICSFLGLDDHTYTHLSARAEDGESFYIYPFGLRFNEVSEDRLLRVTLQGKVIEGPQDNYNPTGYSIHSAIYQSRPDIHSVFHLHTHHMVSVSVLEEGLLPLSQWALHFYQKITYVDYSSLILHRKQSSILIENFKSNYVMFLRHHGGLICGRTLYEAMFYTYHLEQACKVQNMILSTHKSYILLNKETCLQASKDLLAFEDNIGQRDWRAWVRQMT